MVLPFECFDEWFVAVYPKKSSQPLSKTFLNSNLPETAPEILVSYHKLICLGAGVIRFPFQTAMVCAFHDLTKNPRPKTPDPKPQTPDPRPETPDPKPQTPDPNWGYGVWGLGFGVWGFGRPREFAGFRAFGVWG